MQILIHTGLKQKMFDLIYAVRQIRQSKTWHFTCHIHPWPSSLHVINYEQTLHASDKFGSFLQINYLEFKSFALFKARVMSSRVLQTNYSRTFSTQKAFEVQSI